MIIGGRYMIVHMVNKTINYLGYPGELATCLNGCKFSNVTGF